MSPNQLKSGRLNLKVPRSLHTRLVAIAQREKISLNYLVGCMLAAEAEDAESLAFRHDSFAAEYGEPQGGETGFMHGLRVKQGKAG